jgi:DNA polymerase III subunit chi
MSTVILHRIAGAKKALDVCRIVEGLYLAGQRVVVFVADAKRAAILDDYLWTFSQPSFVPHCLWDGATEVVEPVVLVTGELANPNGADTLVIADRVADLAGATAFAEIHDVVAQLAEDAGKAEAWEAAGFTVKDATRGRSGHQR